MTQPRAEFEKLAEKATKANVTVEPYDGKGPEDSVWLSSESGGLNNAPYNIADFIEPDDAAFIAWCFNNRALIARALAALEERK